MDSLEDAIACYELQMPGICGTQPLAAHFLLRFHSKNRAPPAKNGSATTTLTIKPECFVWSKPYSIYGYVSLAGLNFTEAKTSIFLHHLQ